MTSPEQPPIIQMWLDLLGLQRGDRVAIFPAGGGQGMSAKFHDLVVVGDALHAIQVQMQLDGPIWTVFIQGCAVVKEPEVAAPNDMDPEALVAWSDQQGIPVPAEVREFVNNDGQEAISE